MKFSHPPREGALRITFDALGPEPVVPADPQLGFYEAVREDPWPLHK
jgi:hypothetical protein